MIARFLILVQMALRNLVGSPINLLVGLLIFGGSFFFVWVGAVAESVNDGMAKTVVASMTGDGQLYSKTAKDELALLGGGMGGDGDVGVMTNFATIASELEKVPNVRGVVPMGVGSAFVASGNIVDVTMERLRGLYRALDGKSDDPVYSKLSKEELRVTIDAQKAHLRQIIKVLESDASKSKEILEEKAIDQDALEAREKVGRDEFWARFDDDVLGNLEFLENRIAPQVSDAQMLFLRYMGTDLAKFQENFDRMYIVKGTAVPKGQRGYLVTEFMHEEMMKLKNARRLDKLKIAHEEGRLIAKDDELKRFVKENRSQTRDIELQLDAKQTDEAVAKLEALLQLPEEKSLPALLEKFFDTDDQNLEARHAWFYQELAPMLELYKVRVGDMLPIKAFTKAGYMQSVNVKVYGTFAFKGFEKSPMSGSLSLMDMQTFRDLYGYLTQEKLDELKSIQKLSGSKVVTRENAEAELFGDDATLEIEATAQAIDTDKQLSGEGRKTKMEDLLTRVYTQQEIDDGVVLNAAILMKDPSQAPQTLAAIEKVSEQKQLGFKTATWQQAAGMLGNLILVFRFVLFGAVSLIFFVAAIIITSSLVMAMLQRTQMIGTLRAIGAHRAFVLSMVFHETLVLGALFGGGGIVAGALAASVTRFKAFNDASHFLFSGPVLEVQSSPGNLVIAGILVVIVSMLSTLIPALIATGVSPLRAMQSDE